MPNRLTSKPLLIALVVLAELSFQIPRTGLCLPQPNYQAILNSGSIVPAA